MSISLTKNRFVNLLCGKINCAICLSFISLFTLAMISYAISTNNIVKFFIIVSFLFFVLTIYLLFSAMKFIYKNYKNGSNNDNYITLLKIYKPYLELYGKTILIVSVIVMTILASTIYVHPNVLTKMNKIGYNFIVNISLVWISFFSTFIFFLILVFKKEEIQ